MSVTVEEVGAQDSEDLQALFARDHSPCYCRYWHFAGTNKEWEARCAFEREVNATELDAALKARSDEARGLVARLGDERTLVGWMKLAPQRALPKLLARPPYRGLETTGVFAIGCFLVAPAHRRQGIARALVTRAIELAPSWGATHLEAYPRVAVGGGEGLHDFEQWTGPGKLFEELGFEVHRDQPQYPVLRRHLGLQE
jgi:GNAT superfamily N-acetyltransferase